MDVSPELVAAVAGLAVVAAVGCMYVFYSAARGASRNPEGATRGGRKGRASRRASADNAATEGLAICRGETIGELLPKRSFAAQPQSRSGRFSSVPRSFSSRGGRRA